MNVLLTIQEQRRVVTQLEKEREGFITQLYSTYLGLVKGQTYDLMLNGRQRKGRLLGVKRQISSYMLQREYVLEFMVAALKGFSEVRRLVLPSQVIGLEALNLEELDQIFKDM